MNILSLTQMNYYKNQTNNHALVDNIDNDKISFCLIDITWQYPRSHSLQVVFSDCGNDRCVLIYFASIS